MPQLHERGFVRQLQPSESRACVLWQDTCLNSGQGYQACGWIFDAETVFDTIGILEWARLAPVDRVKGIMRTPDGLVRINRQGDDFFIETQNVAPPDSRIELISAVNADWNALQSSLLRIRLSSGG